MAKYLDSQDISANLNRVIKEAKEKLIIISPYLKIHEQIREKIESKSKIANLLQVKILYGKTELKEDEKDWITKSENIKLFFKKNVHAKCFINENEAIISTMNLYDYSQMNNIEMGVVLSRDEDREAYNNLSEDINNILINSQEITSHEESKKIEKKIEEEEKQKDEKLSIEEKKIFEKLRVWRENKAKEEKRALYQILKNDEILEISKKNITKKEDLKQIKGIADVKINKLGNDIINELNDLEKYSLVEIEDTFIQYVPYEGYDRVKVKFLSNNETKWFDTTRELPTKKSIVAAKINGKWFNDYFVVEKQQ